MKKAAWILALLMALCLCAGAGAETQISVSGEGSALVAADTAFVTLGVSTQNRDVRKAQEDVNKAIASIREALIANGVPKDDINTDRINIYGIYGSDSLGEEKITSYRASSSLAIRTDDVDSIGRIIDIAFEAGANTLSEITFSAKDTKQARSEALTGAVTDAREKAEVLAQAAGLRITGIVSICEGYTNSWDSGVNSFLREEKAADGGAQTVVQAAKMRVTSTVTVVYTAQEP